MYVLTVHFLVAICLTCIFNVHMRLTAVAGEISRSFCYGSVIGCSRGTFDDLGMVRLGCISLVKSKIGLLREITGILFCERNKKSEKGLIAD